MAYLNVVIRVEVYSYFPFGIPNLDKPEPNKVESSTKAHEETLSFFFVYLRALRG